MSKRRKLQEWVALLVGKTFNWLTVVSIEQHYYNNKKRGYSAICKCKCGAEAKVSPAKLLDGSVYSCGCYRLSKEIVAKQHAWQSDPNRLASAHEKNKQFYIDHPEKLKEISEKNIAYWQSHPEIVEERARKHHEYYVNNPDKLKHLSEKVTNYYKDNPDASKHLSDALQNI